MNKVLLYCRPGFEKECAAEIAANAAEREIYGFPRVKENSGYVLFECYQHENADRLVSELPFDTSFAANLPCRCAPACARRVFCLTTKARSARWCTSSLIAPGACYVGYSFVGNNSLFYMGIPRLKFAADAPSRSTLKLEEAFHVFIPADEWDERLAGGMHAVYLGTYPGGWTYQLVKRSM